MSDDLGFSIAPHTDSSSCYDIPSRKLCAIGPTKDHWVYGGKESTRAGIVAENQYGGGGGGGGGGGEGGGPPYMNPCGSANKPLICCNNFKSPLPCQITKIMSC